ncbi:hypothetical protein ACQ4PT_039940 [Festuca glaucescens]
MVDPVSLVSTILPIVQLIGSAALTARQNKDKCMELAQRACNIGYGLPDYARAAGNNMATVHGLESLRDALDEAFTLIKSCQESCILSAIFSSWKAADLDKVDSKITKRLLELNFFRLAPGQAMLAHHVAAVGSVPAQTYDYMPNYQAHHLTASGSVPAQTYDYSSNYQEHQVTAGGSAPAQTYDYGSYYQAQGAPYNACVGFPPPQYATVNNMQWIPAPAPYTAAPAPSGSNYSTFYTLPTVNKIFDRVFP